MALELASNSEEKQQLDEWLLEQGFRFSLLVAAQLKRVCGDGFARAQGHIGKLIANTAEKVIQYANYKVMVLR